ncbi:MAG: 3-deoxy-D-manno-octulosonic acid transferase [Halocynthiibacter sp.]
MSTRDTMPPNSSLPPAPLRFRVIYGVYQLAIHALLPLVLLGFLWKSRKEPLYRKGFAARFGLAPKSTAGRVLVFATSLGETRAASPLIRELLNNGHDVYLAHNTPAGMVAGQGLFEEDIATGRVVQSYMAADLFWVLWLFYLRQKFKAVLVIENELWPAMLTEARRLSLPIFEINSSFAEASLQRNKTRLGGYLLWLWTRFTGITTKSPKHIARFLTAGVEEERLHNVGELRFDMPLDERKRKAAISLRERGYFGTHKVLMIASSVEAEEDDLLAYLREVIANCPAVTVIWVPRSPQRFDAVYKKCLEISVNTAKRSDAFSADFVERGDAPQILVGDSLGEMDFYYALSDLMFVGATIADHGGHNVIEPLAHQKPVLTGPSIWGILFPAEDAIEAGVQFRAQDVAELTQETCRLLQSKAALTKMQRATDGFNDTHMGAAARTYALLAPFLQA